MENANEAEPLNVIISSQEEAPVKEEEEFNACEIISDSMQQQAQEFANSQEDEEMVSSEAKEDSDSDFSAQFERKLRERNPDRYQQYMDPKVEEA